MSKGRPPPEKKSNWDNPHWIKNQINKYAGKSFTEADRGLRDLRDMESGKLPSDYGKAFMELFKYIAPGKTFLDLGCNSGGICQFMQERGLIVLGVDLPEVINKIQYDIPKIAMNLEEDFPEGQWDIVYCREVLEHLRNGEDIVLKKIVNAIKPDGVGIIACPYSEHDFGSRCPEHHRLYKDGELAKCAENAGAVVISRFKEKICRSIGVVIQRKK